MVTNIMYYIKILMLLFYRWRSTSSRTRCKLGIIPSKMVRISV